MVNVQMGKFHPFSSIFQIDVGLPHGDFQTQYAKILPDCSPSSLARRDFWLTGFPGISITGQMK
jgi:uncharacterized membrane protein